MTDVTVKALFPTPFMKVSSLLPADLVQACVEHILAADTQINAKSSLLRHTDIADPATESPYQRVNELVTPHLVQFGQLLFGQELIWLIKEIWTNVLEPGGHQAIHAHSNSFISGIIYLTESHPSARTVFHRNIGGREFIFSNDNPNANIGPYNGNKWVGPETHPGDMVLYPSYLLHEVPRNEGQRRMTIALNAIPDRLDTWGYTIRFSSHQTER
ncbi:MAG: putative 2OG-Fe(II) oxygenase [Candidatus Competibacteraceae bacterium]|nr:putative 2OG-Fe(II) oxygenase [Candidatus Competibacteraceae bacterium]